MRKKIHPLEIHAYLETNSFFKHSNPEKQDFKKQLLTERSKVWELEYFTKTPDGKGPLVAVFLDGTNIGALMATPGAFSEIDIKDYFSLEDAGPIL